MSNLKDEYTRTEVGAMLTVSFYMGVIIGMIISFVLTAIFAAAF